MHPLVGVLELGGTTRPIGSYGLCAALAIGLAGFVAVRAARRARVDPHLTLAGFAMVIGAGFASAWITFGLVEWVRTGSPSAWWRGGGLVAFGAVPGAALALWITRRWLGLDTIRVLELSLPAVALGHAVGRMGCFLGGCCYGRRLDAWWAVVYSDPLAPAASPAGVSRHPSPLYEALGLLVLGLVFALVPADRPGDGRRLAAYVAAYCALRFSVELTRGDAIRGVFAGVSTSQVIAVIGFAAAALAGRALARAS